MSKKRETKENRRELKKRFLNIKILTFFAALAVFAVIGLLIPLRPSESAIEKRTLEEFPEFTLASFLNGDYFGDISTWYADTFPFREFMLTANADMEDLYGLKGEQIILADSTDGEDAAATDTDEVETESGEDAGETSVEDEPFEDAAIDEEPEVAGDVYISGDTAFSIYYFSREGADDYVAMIDKAQKKLNGIADVYTVLAPTSIGINLSDRVQEKLYSYDQEEAIDYIYDGINETNSKIHTVEVYNLLKHHDSEYIYFRTDHHWTALGAYYAYTAFCDEKGIEATPIEDYETMEFPDFLGSFYSSSNQAASLKNNPDTVVAYVPVATNDMTFWDKNGTEYPWNIIYDVSDWNAGSKYQTFIAGDEPFAQIENPNLHDGSACVVIKESYGNAFVPFLTDNYEYVYIVDYRY
ncbi:MAG: hypothetical protein LUC41_01545, partial [Clostridiales bacterium]|nr:hypothetical protein [Clostridiales bacterium]